MKIIIRNAWINFDSGTINIAFSYSSQEEIASSIKKAVGDTLLSGEPETFV